MQLYGRRVGCALSLRVYGTRRAPPEGVDEPIMAGADVARELAALRDKVASLELKLDGALASDLRSGTPPAASSRLFGTSPPDSFSSLGPPRTIAMPAINSRKSFGESERDRFRAWAAQRASPENSPRLGPIDDGVSSLYSSRLILTTYPGQVGIEPVPLKWTAASPEERGPVVVSRHPNTVRKRNAIGSHGGGYSVYRGLATALGHISPSFTPDLTNTEPPIHFPQQPSWLDGSIVSFDPLGHIAPYLFAKSHPGIDVRNSASITRAHLKINEIDEAVRAGRIPIDGKILIRSQAPTTGSSITDPGVEVNVSKIAIDPVWHLPGMAARFGISEALLRRALFEETGGSYPVFLPPIGGQTAYIFGPHSFLSDPTKELTTRVHDACGGSDVLGSDVCSCRPYLMAGIIESIQTAQRGGVGLVVYFQKEGRALGEVLKYLVYNVRMMIRARLTCQIRKRAGDPASGYFSSTVSVAGVKDMRYQALMPDILLWLGVTKIDHLVSMSDMKYNAIIQAGIEVKERHELPLEQIPADARVEVDAKIAAGYYSTRAVTGETLELLKGRTWEDVDH